MTDMIEVKTADLIGPALDWAVATATGHYMQENLRHSHPVASCSEFRLWEPSTQWKDGGPLIDKYRVEFTFERDGLIFAELCEEDGSYVASCTGEFGPNHLVATCRSIVFAKLGSTVKTPKELMPCEPES